MADQLKTRIDNIHRSCYLLCKQTLGRYLSNSGNIGVFAQTDQEYQELTKIRDELCLPSDNPNQKYFTLIEPIIIEDAVYKYLYIRQPDPTPYGKYLGDVDFILSENEYLELKNKLQTGETVGGAQIYDRPGWDMIQLTDPMINAISYVSTNEMAKKVHVKF